MHPKFLVNPRKADREPPREKKGAFVREAESKIQKSPTSIRKGRYKRGDEACGEAYTQGGSKET